MPDFNLLSSPLNLLTHSLATSAQEGLIAKTNMLDVAAKYTCILAGQLTISVQPDLVQLLLNGALYLEALVAVDLADLNHLVQTQRPERGELGALLAAPSWWSANGSSGIHRTKQFKETDTDRYRRAYANLARKY